MFGELCLLHWTVWSHSQLHTHAYLMTNVLKDFSFLRLFYSCSFISLFYVRLHLPACIIKPRCNNTWSALN